MNGQTHKKAVYSENNLTSVLNLLHLCVCLQKKKAFAKYQYAIEEIRHNELQTFKAAEAVQRRQDELQQHKVMSFIYKYDPLSRPTLSIETLMLTCLALDFQEAFVEYLNGSQLFQSMFAQDPEAQKLNQLPGVADLVQTYLLYINLMEMYAT